MGAACSSQQQLFFDAVAAGDTSKVVALLTKKGKNRAILNEKDKHGYTALHIAAESGNATIIKLLLERRANVNATTDTGFTAIAIAAKNGNDACVRAVLSFEPDLEKSDLAYANTPLMWGVQNCKEDTVKAILECAGENNIKRMMESKNRFGTTALMMAIEANTGTRKLEIVRSLLKAGANPNTKDSKGRTALSIATDKGIKDVAAELTKGKEEDEDAKAEEEEEAKDNKKKKGASAASGASSSSSSTKKGTSASSASTKRQQQQEEDEEDYKRKKKSTASTREEEKPAATSTASSKAKSSAAATAANKERDETQAKKNSKDLTSSSLTSKSRY